jgi:hypothetical protein
VIREGDKLFDASLDGADWIVVFAYFDETTGGADNQLTAVAGYLFDDVGREQFRSLYRADVEPMVPIDEKKGCKIFHAAPLYDGRPPFDKLEKPIRECILARMAETIRQTVTVGAVVGITQGEYDAGLKGRYISVRIQGQRADSLQPWAGSPYSICLLRCIQGLNEWMDREGLDGKVQYLVEAGAGNGKQEAEAAFILGRVAASPDLSRCYRYASHAFWPKSSDTPWLFAPDYFAWEWQRYDRLSEYPDHGEWRTTMLPLIKDKPHLASYLTEGSVCIQAVVNTFNGLLPRPDRAS